VTRSGFPVPVFAGTTIVSKAIPFPMIRLRIESADEYAEIRQF
jgi:hypothetical protein